MPKTCVIIQARMGSTRLPGKIMKEICGKTILEHDVIRISQAKNIDNIIIATTIEKQDDVIENEAIRLGVKCFRGSESDVLSRYYLAAKEHEANIVVRITSDCPLYDGTLLQEMVEKFKNSECDYLSNCIERTYPRGLDTEIFSFSALERAHKEAKEEHEREHVTPYINGNSNSNNNADKFKLEDFVGDEDNSNLRWTLDTEEDLEFIEAIYGNLYEDNKLFTTSDILNLLNEKPELVEINAHIEQKKISA